MRNKIPTPLVSIGMPVYNGERHLHQALDSLLAQIFTEFELIISDNASTDATPDICREYAARDPRIRYHRQSFNIGPEANFDYVLDRARGNYFMWAAHDDLWEQEFIVALAAFLDAEPGCVLVFPRCDEIDKIGRLAGCLDRLPELARFRSPAARLKRYLRQEGKTGKATVIYGLMRTDAARRTGGMAHCSGAGASWDNLLVFSLLAQGWFGLADRLLFHKRRLINKSRDISRLAQNRRSSIQTHRYYRGYRRIIAGAGCLSDWEKTMLSLAAVLVEVREQWKVWRI